MKHNYYEPTEYEQMLIAAGWIRVEEVDDEYRKYLRTDEDPMEYAHWQSLRHEWDDLNTEYTNKYPDGYPMNDRAAERDATRILDAMSYAETMLGY